MVWAYLGPERPVPPFPAMDWTDLPPDHVVASKQLLSCNYAQAMEGDFDPSHISFLHSSLAAFRRFEELAAGGDRVTAPSPDAGGELTPELEHVYWALDPRPVIMAIEPRTGCSAGPAGRRARTITTTGSTTSSCRSSPAYPAMPGPRRRSTRGYRSMTRPRWCGGSPTARSAR